MEFFLLILLMFGLDLMTCTAYQQTPDQDRLEANIFDGYDRQQRPSLSDQSDPTIVTIGMSLKKLKRVNFSKGTMVLNVKMMIAWTDPRLSWDPAEFAGITKYHVHYSDIWTPNISLMNSNLPRESQPDVYLGVNYHGNINYTPRMKVDVNCTELNEEDDTHECSMSWASWSYGSESVSVEASSDTIDLSRYKEHPAWDVVSSEAVKKSVTYPCCPDVFEDVVFSLVFRRRN